MKNKFCGIFIPNFKLCSSFLWWKSKTKDFMHLKKDPCSYLVIIKRVHFVHFFIVSQTVFACVLAMNVLCVFHSRLSPGRDANKERSLPHYGPRFPPQGRLDWNRHKKTLLNKSLIKVITTLIGHDEINFLSTKPLALQVKFTHFHNRIAKKFNAIIIPHVF